jgi:hypothetical protein
MLAQRRTGVLGPEQTAPPQDLGERLPPLSQIHFP